MLAFMIEDVCETGDWVVVFGLFEVDNGLPKTPVNERRFIEFRIDDGFLLRLRFEFGVSCVESVSGDCCFNFIDRFADEL